MSEHERQRLQARTATGPYPDRPDEHPLIDALKERFGDHILNADNFRGDETVSVSRENLVEVLRFCRDTPALAMDFLMDQTVVDYLDMGDEPRFGVIYHLFSSKHLHRLRIKTRAPEEDCWVPTVTGLWKSALWMEREAWEFYGVVFKDHPDLRPILLYEEFEGYPLRKDYPKSGEQPRVEMRDYRPWPQPRPEDIT